MHARTLAVTAVAALVLTGGFAARPRPTRPEPQPVIAGAPTFDKEVVRIFQASCQTCHHPGDIAPFSLMTYADARAHASDIKGLTRLRQMPPWKPVNGCGEFADARVLTQEQIDTISAWADAGAPEGNASDLPVALTFAGGWALGEPDLVLQNPDPYTPPAVGDMYRCFTLPTNIPSDSYVSAIDVKPGDPESVHHVIAYLDTTGASVKLDQNDPGPGYTSFGGPGFGNPGALGGWAPGARPVMLPDTVAMSLPGNARVVLQVHYHPHHGAPKPDQTRIGIYLAKKKPQKIVRILPLINQDFTIPPGDANYRVNATWPILTPVPLHVWFIAPHMHLLGRHMQVTTTPLSGPSKCLIDISDWDFNWQGIYRYTEPVALPTGSRLSLDAWYDNSADNWRNPNIPPQPVSWGEATTDEMCIAFLGVTIDSENLIADKPADASWMRLVAARD